MNLHLPNLTIDYAGDEGPDEEVALTQEFGGNQNMVSLHPIQVRLIAERIGVMVPDDSADRTIRRLCRQMHAMRSRMETLDDWLRRTREYVREGEDMDQDLAFSDASISLVAEFCRELPYDDDGQPVQHQSPPSVNTNPPISGPIDGGNPPKNGGIRKGNPPKSGGVSQLPLMPEGAKP